MNRKQRRGLGRKPASARAGAAPAAGGDHPAQWLVAAVAEHQAGRIEAAIALYDRVLARTPDHSDALHLKGVAVYQSGDLNQAETLIARAIAHRGDQAEYYSNLGLVQQAKGSLFEAAALYTKALQLKPEYPEARINLGVVCQASGRLAEAEQHYRQALTLSPGTAVTYFNLATVVTALGRSAEAIALYRQCLAEQPDHAEALNNLGNVLQQHGRSDEAMDCYQRALALRPDHADTLNNIGLWHQARRNFPMALDCLQRAIAINPAYADAYNNLGTVLQDLNDFVRAEAFHRHAISLDPRLAKAYNNLGNALQSTDRLEESVAAYRESLSLQTFSPQAWSNLGNALRLLDRMDDAERALRTAVRQDPRFAPAQNNLGFVLQVRGDHTEAEACYRRALEIQPDYAEALGNLGLLRAQMGCSEDAEVYYQKALAIDPRLPLMNFNRALLHLEQGHLQTGWDGYRWRFAAKRARPDRRFAVPEWGGEPLQESGSDTALLVWREQGIGDELMFATAYGELSVGGAGRPCVAIECDTRLEGLLARSFPDGRFRREPPEYNQGGYCADTWFNRHAPAGTVAALHRPQLSSFPLTAGWLRPDAERMAMWRDRLAALGPGLTVGICWRSGYVTTDRRGAYAAIEDWAPILTIPGVHFVCLQYDECGEELAAVAEQLGVSVTRWADTDLKTDLEAAAALTAGLNLVVTAATSVGEMAGALGVPVWRLCSYADWTRLGTSVRPWFPSMRQFSFDKGNRSKTDAIREAARALRRLLPPTPAPTASSDPNPAVYAWGPGNGELIVTVLQPESVCS